MSDGQQQPKDISQRIYLYALQIIKIADVLEQRGNRALAQQLLRSGTSVGANVAEAQAGSSRKDFVNFLQHALKSANETFFWLNLVTDSGKLQHAETVDLLKETEEIRKILGSSVKKLRRE